jgi:tRNA-2-methylthio-N6-dimethylallyladenosine synthase
MAKTLYIKTYGCQMNEHDSARIVTILKKHLHVTQTDTLEEADIILFNTCSVREKAAEKVFSDLGRIKHLKEKNPELLIGVGGCVAVQIAQKIFQRAPYVNLVFGPQSLHRLPQLFTQASHKKVIDLDYTPLEKLENLPLPKQFKPSAEISIIEGCHHFCTYCIVPYVRGKAVSRSFASIINEAKALAQLGTQEIHLLGQNVNCYKSTDTDSTLRYLPDLLYEIAQIPQIKRIRITTSHPGYFSKALIEAYRDIPALVNHAHIPIQSGSNTILKKMNRRYTKEDYIELVATLKSIRPHLSVSSDFIVGFPFETEKDFEQTLDLIHQLKFDRSFSFIYSPRPGTKAYDFGDTVPLAVKKERIQRLQTVLSTYETRISQSMLHTKQRVLITGLAKKSKDQLAGRTENNRIVNIEGTQSLIGQMVNVIITKVMSHSLHSVRTDPRKQLKPCGLMRTI